MDRFVVLRRSNEDAFSTYPLQIGNIFAKVVKSKRTVLRSVREKRDQEYFDIILSLGSGLPDYGFNTVEEH